MNGREARTLTQTWDESDFVTVRLPKKKHTKRVRVDITRNGQRAFYRTYKIPGTKSLDAAKGACVPFVGVRRTEGRLTRARPPARLRTCNGGCRHQVCA